MWSLCQRHTLKIENLNLCNILDFEQQEARTETYNKNLGNIMRRKGSASLSLRQVAHQLKALLCHSALLDAPFEPHTSKGSVTCKISHAVY